VIPARYDRETLEVRYKDKLIADVLDMTVEEAAELFKAVPSIRDKMETLKRVGLSYVKVGQQATTLSGGEAQRVKLAKELSRRSTGRTLYILDEPTTGLHFHDVAQLLDVLHELVDQGNTMIVIEHNLEVVKTADWIVDMGPEGGGAGGEVVAEGTPEQIARNPNSYTGRYLKPVLARKAKGGRRAAE
jgi:excinuclease ABC subunit A